MKDNYYDSFDCEVNCEEFYQDEDYHDDYDYEMYTEYCCGEDY